MCQYIAMTKNICKLTRFSLAFVFFFHNTFDGLDQLLDSKSKQLANHDDITVGCINPIILVNTCVLAFIC